MVGRLPPPYPNGDSEGSRCNDSEASLLEAFSSACQVGTHKGTTLPRGGAREGSPEAAVFLVLLSIIGSGVGCGSFED